MVEQLFTAAISGYATAGGDEAFSQITLGNLVEDCHSLIDLITKHMVILKSTAFLQARGRDWQ